MKLSSLILVFFSFLTVLKAQIPDIRKKVAEDLAEKGPNVIDPNDSFFGISVRATEDEIFDHLGQPQAYLRLDAKNTAAIYDGNRGFIFTDGKLTGVRLGSSLIDFHLLKDFGARNTFIREKWSLDNGIKQDMTLDAVTKILGKELKSPEDSHGNYHKFYQDGESTVNLYFASFSNHRGKGGTVYTLHGLMVVKK